MVASNFAEHRTWRTKAVRLGCVHAVPAPLRPEKNNGHPQIRFGECLHYWSIDERVQRRSNVHVAVRSDRIGQLAAGRSRS
jgi:hypothetical protein